MIERSVQGPGEPESEALSSAGLLLNVAAVLAFATGLAGFSSTPTLASGALMGVAVALFAASLLCFAAGGSGRDTDRPDQVMTLENPA